MTPYELIAETVDKKKALEIVINLRRLGCKAYCKPALVYKIYREVHE